MRCPSEKTLVQYADFTLSDTDAAVVRAHLAVCLTCEEAVEWIRVHVLTRPLRKLPDGDYEDDEDPALDLDWRHPDEPSEPYDWSPNELIPSEDTESVPRDGGDAPPPHRLLEFDVSSLDWTDYPGAIGRVGQYEVLEKLGNGGFGTVVRAWDSVERRLVAIKMLSSDRLAEPDAVERFHREIRASTVKHPNVVSILAVGEHRGQPILVMEYMAGGSLRDRLKRSPPMTPFKILRYGAQVAAGLAAIHAAGMIHCDIKPSNILLDAPTGGNAKIGDFGLACSAADPIDHRTTESSSGDVVLCTPAFMSPDQLGSQPIDARSDLFSLGSMLYALVLGQSPFQGKSHFDSAHKIVNDTPRSLISINPDISPVLSDVADRLLQKDRDNRIPTAQQVADILGEELRKLS